MTENNGPIFHVDKVSKLRRKTMVKHVFLRCFKVEASVLGPEIEKANVQARASESNSHAFNLRNCSVITVLVKLKLWSCLLVR